MVFLGKTEVDTVFCGFVACSGAGAPCTAEPRGIDDAKEPPEPNRKPAGRKARDASAFGRASPFGEWPLVGGLLPLSSPAPDLIRGLASFRGREQEEEKAGSRVKPGTG